MRHPLDWNAPTIVAIEVTYWTQVAAVAVALYVIFFVPGYGGHPSRLQKAPVFAQVGIMAILLVGWWMVPSRWIGRALVTTYPRHFWLAPVVIWAGLSIALFWSGKRTRGLRRGR